MDGSHFEEHQDGDKKGKGKAMEEKEALPNRVEQMGIDHWNDADKKDLASYLNMFTAAYKLPVTTISSVDTGTASVPSMFALRKTDEHRSPWTEDPRSFSCTRCTLSALVHRAH
jgi:hypothetical protein